MTLSALIARVEEGAGSDLVLDGLVWKAATEKVGDDWQLLHDIWCLRAPDDSSVFDGPPNLTNSLDAVVWFLGQVLPGFWWRGGTCYLSSEARVCPDHNCPTHGARLMVECPPSLDIWNEGIEVELRPGSQPALVRALLAATLRALSALEDSKADLADATNGDRP